MTISSAERGKFAGAGAVGRRVRAIVDRFRHPFGLKDTGRAEFEQLAQDLDLSHPELHRLLAGRGLSAVAVETGLKNLELLPDRTGSRREPEQAPASEAAQTLLPIGPACC